MPTTLLEGLLSGITHPAVGLDHLTFMIAIGLAATLAPASLVIIACFVAACLVGIAVHGVLAVVRAAILFPARLLSVPFRI